MAEGFSLFGDFQAPTLDAGAFSLGDTAGADWTSGLGQGFNFAPESPASPGMSDWMNSLSTGAGTYGTGVPRFNEFANNLNTPTNPPDTGWGFGDFMKAGAGGLGALGNILGLGVSGLGMANAVRAMQQGGQQQKIMNQAQKQAQQVAQQAQQVAQPAAQAGGTLTRAGEQAMMGGPLPEYLEGLVERRKSEARGKLNDYFARNGISDSTMIKQYETWIDQQADVQRQAYAESLLSGGYRGIQTATGPLGTAGQAIGQSGNWASGQMGGTDKFLQEANRSIALLTGAQRAPGQ